MSEGEGPPRPPSAVYATRKVIRDEKTGRTEENYVMDPYGGRYQHPGENEQLDTLNMTYGGLLSKFVFLGHIPKDQMKQYNKHIAAWAHLQRMAVKVPSLQATADLYLESHLLGPATAFMGQDGAAVVSENTNRTVDVHQEIKKSRWSLSRG